MGQRKPVMPIWMKYGIAILVPLSLLPFLLIALSREVRSDKSRISIFQDMAVQPKLKAQAFNARFADGRAMRPHVAGTVARDQLRNDEHYYQGKIQKEGKWEFASDYPKQSVVDMKLLARGRERFNIYCATCHGHAGYGDGLVQRRAELLETSGWVQPSNLHLQDKQGQLIYGEKLYPNGQLFHTITKGVRSMPAYGSQIDVGDRWAIVAYVRALQLSQTEFAQQPVLKQSSKKSVSNDPLEIDR